MRWLVDRCYWLYTNNECFLLIIFVLCRSVLISYHHVGCLAVVVVLLVFAIRFNDLLHDIGIASYFVVFSIIMAPITVIYCQCRMAGDVVDVSERFKETGRIMIPRKFMFGKFTKSCTIFYIEVTYPFYTVTKETFTAFCQYAQDYSMELLLWK